MATLQTLPEATTLLPAGASPGSGSFAVRAFLYAVFKHRRLVIGIFLLVFLASLVAAIIHTSTGSLRVLPSRRTCRDSSAVRSLTWSTSGSSPISSRNSVP